MELASAVDTRKNNRPSGVLETAGLPADYKRDVNSGVKFTIEKRHCKQIPGFLLGRVYRAAGRSIGIRGGLSIFSMFLS